MKKTTENFSYYRERRWIPTFWKMMSIWKLNERSLSIILLNIHHHNINNESILICNTSKICIHHNINIVSKGGVEIFKAEDNNKEEKDLVVEEAKSYVITMGIQDIFPDISNVLQRHVHIGKHLITLLNSICN